MLWVGGSIVIHGMHELGVHHPYEDIHHLAEAAGHRVSEGLSGALEWVVSAACSGVLGVVYGLLIVGVLKLAMRARSSLG